MKTAPLVLCVALGLLTLTAVPAASAIGGPAAGCQGNNGIFGSPPVDVARLQETDCFVFIGVVEGQFTTGLLITNECTLHGTNFGIDRSCTLSFCVYTAGVLPGCTDLYEHPYTLP